MTDLDKPVKLSERTVVRKKLSTLRADGMVPAVIHNHGAESVHVMAPELELVRIYREAGKHHPLNLEVGSEKYLALIKDAHFNPVKRRLQHVVFQAIRKDEKVEAEVPIHIEGEIPAEKIGLMILRQLDHVEVEALPANLPDELTVDGAKLAELHDKITVADLKVPEGVEVLTEAEHPIAMVVETKAQMAEEEEVPEGEVAEGEEGEETAEGEEAQVGEAQQGRGGQEPSEKEK